MADTGFLYPGTTENYDIGCPSWANTDNIKSSNDTGSTCTVDKDVNTGLSDNLIGSNFSSGIPSGATIDGIEVVIRRKAAAASVIYDNVLKCVIGHTAQGSNYASATKYGTGYEDITYGGATDKWGWSPTQANMVDSSFGIQLSVATISSTAYAANVDYIKIKIYYTAGGGATLPLKNVFSRPFSGVFR